MKGGQSFRFEIFRSYYVGLKYVSETVINPWQLAAAASKRAGLSHKLRLPSKLIKVSHRPLGYFDPGLQDGPRLKRLEGEDLGGEAAEEVQEVAEENEGKEQEPK